MNDAIVLHAIHALSKKGSGMKCNNKKLIGGECPQCSLPETWERAIKYNKVRNMQQEFIKETASKLIKNKHTTADVEVILEIIEGIVKYFKSADEEHDATQQCIGCKELFRGFAVKDWKGSNFNCTKCASIEKILVKKAVLFYNQCWKNRNKEYHNAEKQKDRLI